MASIYPLEVIDYRHLSHDYSGPVFIWDIDKTYLATRFSSMRQMARIPVEFAVDKQAIAGMPQVLRGLRRGASGHFACAPIYFVSASPPQLRKVIERKMLLDAVDYDGITFKDWLGVISQLRPQRFREQVGFKVCALLEGRLRRPLATEYLFGDDVEKDALAYSSYARIINDGLSGPEVEALLLAADVAPEDRQCVQRLRAHLPLRLGTVAGSFIHLENLTPPEAFRVYGPGVVPTRNGFQLALALFDRGLVDTRTVKEAYHALQKASVFGRFDYDQMVKDAHMRGVISSQRLEQIGW